MSSFDFQRSTITKFRKGTTEDPYIDITESFKVVNNIVVLSEIPDDFTKVTVSGESVTWVETNSDTNILANYYYVDYLYGLVKFNSTRNGLTLSFTYKGKGCEYTSAKRIFLSYTTNPDGSLDVDQTLQQLLDTITTHDTTYTSNETTRISNESTRQSNESTRQSQESTRQTLISELGYVDDWISGTDYKKNNFVTYNNSSYMCILDIDNSTVNPSVDTTHWKIIALAGSVVEVTSSSTDISVQDTTTSPILTLNSGEGVNQIVKRNDNAEVPGNLNGDYVRLGNMKLVWNSTLNSIDFEYIG